MWHGYVAVDGTEMYAKGKPLASQAARMTTAKTQKELFQKLAKIKRERKAA